MTFDTNSSQVPEGSENGQRSTSTTLHSLVYKPCCDTIIQPGTHAKLSKTLGHIIFQCISYVFDRIPPVLDRISSVLDRIHMHCL